MGIDLVRRFRAEGEFGEVRGEVVRALLCGVVVSCWKREDGHLPAEAAAR